MRSKAVVKSTKVANVYSRSNSHSTSLGFKIMCAQARITVECLL